MTKPVAGTPYTVKEGDNLSRIAAAAYGDGTQWRRIWKANQSTLKSSDPNLIYPGEVLNIPGLLPEIAALETKDVELQGKDADDLTIVVEGRELTTEAARITRSIDSAADGWTATVEWSALREDLSRTLRPYGYQEAAAYLGGRKVIQGRLYSITHILDYGGSKKELEGWSYAADAIDSTIKPPYEEREITLEQRAKNLLDPLGIEVIFDIDDTETFPKVIADETQTIFDHLSELAAQRGALITSSETGAIQFIRAAFGAPVATIEEGRPPFQSGRITFDGRSRFSSYKAVGQSPRRSKVKAAVANDTAVPRSRFLTFRSDYSTAENIQQTADWRRSKQVAKSLSVNLPVTSWYSSEGELWRENSIISVVSPTLAVPDGYNFLIRAVEYSFSNDGTTALLSLVPPQAYTGEEIEEPWLEG